VELEETKDETSATKEYVPLDGLENNIEIKDLKVILEESIRNLNWR